MSFRPYEIENVEPDTSGAITTPYEKPEFHGSETLEGVKSGLRDIARLVPQLGKLYTRKPDSNMGNVVKQSLSLIPGVPALLKGASSIYDSLPSFFSRSHADVKRDEGTPLPKKVTESTRYKIGEFVGMDLPFAALDLTTSGATSVARHGAQAVLNQSAKKLAMKSTYMKGALEGGKNLTKNAVAGSVSTELKEQGAPEWASDTVGILTGKAALPYAAEKSGIYVLKKGYEYIIKKQAKTSPAGITPTWANTSNDAASEIALGVLQKDMATRNIMKDFVASQDNEFKNSLMNVIDVDTSIVNDAENFLVDVLESKGNVLSQEEEALASQQASAGEESQALSESIKAAKTKAEGTQEAATQILEDVEPVKRPNIQPQRQQIVDQSTKNLPQQEVSVSDQVISNAGRNIRASAQTPADQKAAELIDSIPVITEAPTQAVESIYDGIAPRIGQPEAGELYKEMREQAYQIANTEKSDLYARLSQAAQDSGYEVPEVQFNQMMEMVDNQISSLQNLPFRSPQQEIGMQRLIAVSQAFNSSSDIMDMGDGIIMSMRDVPTLTRLWEARKSFGQSINWKSNLPAEKILKEQYHKFNNALERQMKQAGLLDMYNEANQMYINRFLPLEQGTNGRVKYMQPQEAGRVLNLDAIQAIQQFIPLNYLNPLRRHALEKIMGTPKTGEMPSRQIQKLENVRRYLTPTEQAQFSSLADMELIQARVAANQLGNIERFIEANRSTLSPEVIKNLDRVAEELRANMDLPVEYLTGRAQLAELERHAAEQYEALKGEQKAQVKAIKREVRKVKAEAKAEIEAGAQKKQQLAEKIRELEKTKKNIAAQRVRLQKSLLSTVLQQDTNKALLTQMSTPDGIAEVKALFGDSPTGRAIFNELKLRKAQQIFENAGSISAIAKLMETENSRLLLKELLPADMYSKVDDLSKLAQEMQIKLRYFVNQSNTEVQRMNMQTFKELAGAFISLFTKGVVEGGSRLIAKVAVPAAAKIAMAKAMTDPKFLSKSHDFFVKNMAKDPGSKETLKSAKEWMDLLLRIGITLPPSPEEKKTKNK